MFFKYLQILIPLIGIVTNMFTQIISFKSFSKIGLLKSEYLGFIVGFLSILIIEIYLYSVRITTLGSFLAFLISNSIIYCSLGFCYFTFINLGETARRVRILWEINDSYKGLSMKEILERYNAKEIVEKRLNRLINNGQILVRDEKLYIGNPVMLLIAKMIVKLKIVVLGRASEFDHISKT